MEQKNVELVVFTENTISIFETIETDLQGIENALCTLNRHLEKMTDELIDIKCSL